MGIQEALKEAWAKLSGRPEEKPVAITPEAIINRFKVDGEDREGVQRINLARPDFRRALPTSPYCQLFRTVVEIYNSGVNIETGNLVEANLILYDGTKPTRVVPLTHEKKPMEGNVITLCFPRKLEGVFTHERPAEIFAEIKNREGASKKIIFDGIEVSSTFARDKY